MKKLFFIYVVLILILIAGIVTCKGQSWTPNKKYIAKRDTTASQVKKFQCWGTTGKGLRCKRKLNADHSFCYQHAGQK